MKPRNLAGVRHSKLHPRRMKSSVPVRACSIWRLAVFAVLVATVRSQDLPRAAFIGVVASPVTDELRQKVHVPPGVGVLVSNLIAGGSGKDAGLQANDVLTQINDHLVSSPDDFVATVTRLHAGDTAVIRFISGGQEYVKRVILRPRPYESAPGVETLYRAVSVDGSLRRVIVTKPKDEARHPAVLYITGIGCFSQDTLDIGTAEAKLLYGLTRAGFVTMRVEKSAMGDSQGPACMSPEVDLHAELRGYLAGLAALRQYPFVDPDNLFVVGLSIGGVLAPLVAQEIPVRGLVVVNTVAKPFLEYLTDTRRRQNLLRHVPYDELERRLRLNEECNHRLLIDKQTPEQVAKADPACGDFIQYPAPYTYMQQWASLNLAAEWKKVNAPVLVIYGTSDYISTIADDPYLADIINSFHPGHASLKAIPGMDHYLTRAATMEESVARTLGTRGEFASAVLDEIRVWLQQTLNGAGVSKR